MEKAVFEQNSHGNTEVAKSAVNPKLPQSRPGELTTASQTKLNSDLTIPIAGTPKAHITYINPTSATNRHPVPHPSSSHRGLGAEAAGALSVGHQGSLSGAAGLGAHTCLTPPPTARLERYGAAPEPANCARSHQSR